MKLYTKVQMDDEETISLKKLSVLAARHLCNSLSSGVLSMFTVDAHYVRTDGWTCHS